MPYCLDSIVSCLWLIPFTFTIDSIRALMTQLHSLSHIHLSPMEQPCGVVLKPPDEPLILVAHRPLALIPSHPLHCQGHLSTPLSYGASWFQSQVECITVVLVSSI